MKVATVVMLAVIAGAAGTEAADDSGVIQRAEDIVRESFSHVSPEEWKARLSQDETQTACSRYRNAPPTDVTAKIVADAQQSMQYPPDGKMLGDWREGEKLAAIGTGGQLSRIQPDPPDRKRGGNCYACHALAPKEVSAGNLGPSLIGYGKRHGTSANTIKFIYEKIYNAQASFPCSHMPRFGRNRWLTPKQIADTVAFLLDPESPVNR